MTCSNKYKKTAKITLTVFHIMLQACMLCRLSYVISFAGGQLLLVSQLEMLDIDGFLNLLSPLYGWLYICLPCTEFADSPGLLEFPLELLEGFLDVFPLFDRNNNHSSKSPPFISGCKGK